MRRQIPQQTYNPYGQQVPRPVAGFAGGAYQVAARPAFPAGNFAAAQVQAQQRAQALMRTNFEQARLRQLQTQQVQAQAMATARSQAQFRAQALARTQAQARARYTPPIQSLRPGMGKPYARQPYLPQRPAVAVETGPLLPPITGGLAPLLEDLINANRRPEEKADGEEAKEDVVEAEQEKQPESDDASAEADTAGPKGDGKPNISFLLRYLYELQQRAQVAGDPDESKLQQQLSTDSVSLQLRTASLDQRRAMAFVSKLGRTYGLDLRLQLKPQPYVPMKIPFQSGTVDQTKPAGPSAAAASVTDEKTPKVSDEDGDAEMSTDAAETAASTEGATKSEEDQLDAEMEAAAAEMEASEEAAAAAEVAGELDAEGTAEELEAQAAAAAEMEVEASLTSRSKRSASDTSAEVDTSADVTPEEEKPDPKAEATRLNKLKVAQLRTELEAKGLPTDGVKAVLVKRLLG